MHKDDIVAQIKAKRNHENLQSLYSFAAENLPPNGRDPRISYENPIRTSRQSLGSNRCSIEADPQIAPKNQPRDERLNELIKRSQELRERRNHSRTGSQLSNHSKQGDSYDQVTIQTDRINERKSSFNRYDQIAHSLQKNHSRKGSQSFHQILKQDPPKIDCEDLDERLSALNATGAYNNKQLSARGHSNNDEKIINLNFKEFDAPIEYQQPKMMSTIQFERDSLSKKPLPSANAAAQRKKKNMLFKPPKTPNEAAKELKKLSKKMSGTLSRGSSELDTAHASNFNHTMSSRLTLDKKNKERNKNYESRNFEDFMRIKDGLKLLAEITTARKYDAFTHLQSYSNYKKNKVRKSSTKQNQLTLQERFDQLKKQQLSVKMRQKQRLEEKYQNNLKSDRQSRLSSRNRYDSDQGAQQFEQLSKRGESRNSATDKLSSRRDNSQLSKQKFEEKLTSIKQEFNKQLNDLKWQMTSDASRTETSFSTRYEEELPVKLSESIKPFEEKPTFLRLRRKDVCEAMVFKAQQDIRESFQVWKRQVKLMSFKEYKLQAQQLRKVKLMTALKVYMDQRCEVQTKFFKKWSQLPSRESALGSILQKRNVKQTQLAVKYWKKVSNQIVMLSKFEILRKNMLKRIINRIKKVDCFKTFNKWKKATLQQQLSIKRMPRLNQRYQYCSSLAMQQQNSASLSSSMSQGRGYGRDKQPGSAMFENHRYNGRTSSQNADQRTRSREQPAFEDEEDEL